MEVKSGQRSSRHDQKEIRLCRVHDNHISCVRLPVWKPRTIREIFFSRNYWTEDCRPILCSCATSTPDGDLVPGTHRNVGIRRESNSDLTQDSVPVLTVLCVGEVPSVLCSDVLATVTQRLDLVEESRGCSLQ